MPESIKALIVVLILGSTAFYFTRQLARSVVTRHEFTVWRNTWFVVTITAFLSGNFFIFSIVAVIVCIYAHSVRGATVALFVILLVAVPSSDVPIGFLGAINNLIELNDARLLSIVLLLPLLLLKVRSSRRGVSNFAGPDRLIVAYVMLTSVLAFRQANVTSVMRNTTTLILDILIPYFAFSRTVTDLAKFRRALMAFIVAILPLSLVAVFETVKGWPLYGSVAAGWGESLGVVGREGMLRASGTAGPIVLGLLIMVAIGCTLAVRQSKFSSRRLTAGIFGALILGLIATLSRGPWVGTAALAIIYMLTARRGIAKLGLFAMVGALAFGILLQLPVGQALIKYLPFVGSVDAGTVSYRQSLFENAIPVIERNLLFGSVDYLTTPEMQKLVTGQQIVDIVNTYLGIALNYGIIGLGLFVSIFATVLLRLQYIRAFRFRNELNGSIKIYARVMMATLVAILVTIATVSSVGFVPYIYWSFAGLSVALIRIAYDERAASARVVGGSRDF